MTGSQESFVYQIWQLGSWESESQKAKAAPFEQRCRKVERNRNSRRMRCAGPETTETWRLLAIGTGAQGGHQRVVGPSLKRTVTNTGQITRTRFCSFSPVHNSQSATHILEVRKIIIVNLLRPNSCVGIQVKYDTLQSIGKENKPNQRSSSFQSGARLGAKP